MSDEDLTEDNGEALLAPKFENTCRLLVEAKARLSKEKKIVEGLEFGIKNNMGSNRFLEAGKYTVTWQTQHRKEYTVPAGTTRRFSIKERTDGD